MKKLAILGSTGSVGRSTLRVVQHLGERACVKALAAHSNIDLLFEQAKQFQPDLIAVFDKEGAHTLQKRLPHCTVLAGEEGLKEVATYGEVNFVVSAIVGTAGLLPTIAAIEAGKTIGLANKEVLVSAGEIVVKLAREKGVQLLPIDSEHSAIFQCLQGESNQDIKRIVLTASGGPFHTYSKKDLVDVTVEDALKHPTWKMGKKITVDSSTLMNKGLEVIEAHWLFGTSPEKIDVVIHPQSLIHSMVEFIDGSLIAQMNEPEMVNPIQYAITYPERLPGMFKTFDFSKYGCLNFALPDTSKFSCLRLAYQAMREGGTMACCMNAANEILVERFLNKEISWHEIASKLEDIMLKHSLQQDYSLEDIVYADGKAREEAKLA